MTSAEHSIRPGPVVLRAYACLGLAIAALGLVQPLAEDPGSAHPLVMVAGLACGGAVAALPRFLLPGTLAVCAAVVSMVALVEVPLFTSFLATMIAAFTMARYATARTAALGFAAVAVSVAVVAVPELRAADDGLFGLVYPVVYFGGAALLGWLTRQRARHVAALRDVAAALERERQQQVALAAAAERERLAREMHDVVSHGVSLMVVQAEAAGAVLRSRPDDAARALEAISGTGRAAMNDLHRMLGVLRGSATDLDDIADRVRAAGLAVRLDIDPGWESLDDPVRLALFRVAQEAVTNAVRHAEGADHLTIRVTRSPGTVVLEVRDNGSAAKKAGVGLGSGLQGLRERVTALGGTLDAAALVDDGGFAVRARVPVGSP